MKNKFTKLMAALALLMFLIPITGWGQTTTENVTLSNGTFSEDHITWTCANGNITITQLKGNGSAAVSSSYISAPRVYKGHILSFEGTNNYMITSISITYNGSYTGNSMTAGTVINNNVVTDNTTDVSRTWATTSGGTHVVSSVSDAGLSAIHIQNVASSTNTQLRPTAISITYIASGGQQPTTYTVTYNANVTGISPIVDNYNEGDDVTLRPANTFTNEGYTFEEWNTQADGDGDGYEAGGTISDIQDDIELYAIWTENTGGNTATTVTYDFSTTNNFLTSYPGSTHPGTGNTNNLGTFYYTNGDAFTATGTNRYFNSGYFFLGKSGATLQLPTFDFAVEKIEITGRSGASGQVTQNIYVGNTAVSDETTGATGTNTYLIDEDYQAAGTVYTLKVTSNANTQITQIKVYEKVDTGEPSISADPVEIAYDVTSGIIMYEIQNYVAGSMEATTTADWISNFTYDQVDEIGEVGFTATANTSATARTATVTLTYTYSRGTVTKNVTVTQTGDPNYVMTITEARAQTVNTEVTTKGVVTTIVGNTAYIQDANAAICVYGSSTYPVSANVGDEIRVTGTLTNYNNLLEITDPTYIVLSQNNTVTPEVMTIANILTSTNQGWFVKIEGATVGATSSGNTTLTQNGSSIVARNLSGASQGDVINLTGNISVYNTTKQIANPAVVYDPSVSINPATANPFTYVYGQGPSEEQIFEVTGAHLTSSDITVTVTAGSEYFEITDNQTYGSTVTIASGDAVSVRLKAGLAVNANYAGTLTIASQGADDVTVALSGSVTNPTYTITDWTGSWGHIEFSPSNTVEAGQQVTLTVVPDDAHYYQGHLTFRRGTEIIDDITDATNPYVYTMPAYNVTVSAELWAKPQYEITTVVTPENSGTIVTDEYAWVGKTVEIMVEANAGYQLQSLTAIYVEGGETQELTITDNTFVMPGYPVTVTATFEELTEVTYDFTKIEGFSDWGTSYDEHVVAYPTATVTFASANRQTSTITDQPVTKGNPVTIVMAEGITLTSAAFVCTQWGDKAQTITLHYSTDGGTTFTSTGVTSTNFSINSNLPAGTNAVKITFSSSSNQVGIASATVNIQSGVHSYTLTLGDHENINDYYVFVDNENNPVEFDENDEMEVFEGANVYVSVAEVEDCYLFNGINVVYGDNQKADTTKYDPMYYSFVMPAGDATLNFVTSQATQYTLTVAGSHFEFDNLLVGSESDVVTLDANNQAEICEQLNVVVDGLTVDPGYVLTSVTLTDNEETITVTPNAGGLYEFQMPSSDATLTFTTELAPAADYFELFSGNLEEGDYIIYYNGYAMKNEEMGNDKRLAYETVTADNDIIATNNASIVWHIAPSGAYWTIYSAEVEAFAASTGAKNKAQMLADGTDDMALWTVTGQQTQTYEFVNKKNYDANVNCNLRNNGTYGFACYSTSTGGALSLYKKVETETQSLTNINGYTNDNVKDGYNLIASPVIVDPQYVLGMTAGDYDLYYFNEAEEGEEWRNYKDNHFNLVPGKGYLYAKKAAPESQTFEFDLTGVPYNVVEVALDYTAGVYFAGWNLIGNPYPTTAALDKAFYRMNTTGSGFISEVAGDVNAMEGVFVKATEANQTATFTAQNAKSGKKNTAKVELMLNGNKGIIDNAIVRFDEGETLEKFVLFENSTKLYFTEGNQDYAIVRSNGQGEMPVNFKASKNGNYTISVNADNTEMNYMHLIDNLTGADIDLLATPSYSFEAKTTDYASRFRLVFSASDENGASTGSTTFAYFNGSEWNVSNTGEATLQVIDMLGRIVSSETINGNATMSTANLGAGIYVMRLINGENVMTQKIVVR